MPKNRCSSKPVCGSWTISAAVLSVTAWLRARRPAIHCLPWRSPRRRPWPAPSAGSASHLSRFPRHGLQDLRFLRASMPRVWPVLSGRLCTRPIDVRQESDLLATDRASTPCPLECPAERLFGVVAEPSRDCRDGRLGGCQKVLREVHAPVVDYRIGDTPLSAWPPSARTYEIAIGLR
jgi:hypothetical protein